MSQKLVSGGSCGALAALALLAGCLGLFGQPPGGAPGGAGSDGGTNMSGDAGSSVGDGGARADAAATDGGPDGAGGTETLTVAFDTTQVGGTYAPKNVVAVWIQDSGGAFVKTIGRWADTRRQYLLDWNAKAGANDTDAISGATRADHAQRLTVTWDMTARGGGATADGTYTIRMELADQNSNSNATNHEGSFTFNRNGTASTQDVSGNGFNAVNIQYSGR